MRTLLLLLLFLQSIPAICQKFSIENNGTRIVVTTMDNTKSSYPKNQISVHRRGNELVYLRNNGRIIHNITSIDQVSTPAATSMQDLESKIMAILMDGVNGLNQQSVDWIKATLDADIRDSVALVRTWIEQRYPRLTMLADSVRMLRGVLNDKLSKADTLNKFMPRSYVPPAQQQADWNATSGETFIRNKPTIPTRLSDLTNNLGYLTAVPPQPWNSITGKPSFSAVALSGLYSDLIGRPTIPTRLSDLMNDSGYLTALPAISYNSLTDKPSIPSTTTQVSEGSNLYFTAARARSSLVAGSGIVYDPATGTISAAALSPAYNNSPARPVNGTSFQISTTKEAKVSYTITHTIALTLVLTSGSSTVFLEISPNGSTGWMTISSAGYSDGVAVAVALTKTTTNNVQGVVPAGFFVRLRSVTAGAGSVAFTSGQEALN